MDGDGDVEVDVEVEVDVNVDVLVLLRAWKRRSEHAIQLWESMGMTLEPLV